MKNLSDEQIITSINAGNSGDFALLVDRYKDKAFSLLKRMLKNEMDAEEVLQDSFMKAYNSLGNFRFEAKFSTWFYKIVYNSALSSLAGKKKQIEKEMASIDDLYDLGNDDMLYSTTEDIKEYIYKTIDELPIRNALVIIMFYVDEMSLKDISEILDISLVNSKVLLHRSRNKLRDMILKHNYQEELL